MAAFFIFLFLLKKQQKTIPHQIESSLEHSSAGGGDRLLNERIRRERSKRQSPPIDSKEAETYIKLVKEQQQRGLQKLMAQANTANSSTNYKVDPYTLRAGDYVVHKKVGVGRFVGIKFVDASKASSHPVEYVFIEYADGMTKLPIKQASTAFICIPNETKKPRALSKLHDTSAWERRRIKGKVAIQKMVVDLMELYLHRQTETASLS
ncbi:transcription-repair-coupling factor [Striga asiatica]|uniref:Transcription-repair-coupling factor n=1 Tax=Striga asiatica TaxID=4170 RepID=A0A5A7PSS0_STRAF|nr:transcription-repair-coupling factor [Striga asiatica]